MSIWLNQVTVQVQLLTPGWSAETQNRTWAQSRCDVWQLNINSKQAGS